MVFEIATCWLVFCPGWPWTTILPSTLPAYLALQECTTKPDVFQGLLNQEMTSSLTYLPGSEVIHDSSYSLTSHNHLPSPDNSKSIMSFAFLTCIRAATYLCYLQSGSLILYIQIWDTTVPHLIPFSDLDCSHMPLDHLYSSPQSGGLPHQPMIQKQYSREIKM
jgi:hypothetical protein